LLALCLRDLPGHEQAFARFEALRRPQVEQIVKAAARINNSKAAGSGARRVRDTILPLIFKFVANSKQARWPFARHIDWDTPISATIGTR
jgi:2-polyprenyl-6-methoxyphenol hydroxylase-like FAD-dependent oxidoreductase